MLKDKMGYVKGASNADLKQKKQQVSKEPVLGPLNINSLMPQGAVGSALCVAAGVAQVVLIYY